MARLFRGVTLGFLTGFLGLVVCLTPFGLDLEESVGLEILFTLRGARQAPDDVMIVSIDDASADQLNLSHDPARWPRAHHARVVDNLADAGAAVIVFDIIFHEARSPEHDSLFAEAIRKAQNVVLFEYLKRETVPLTDWGGSPTRDLHIQTRVPPIPLLSQAALAIAPFPLPKVPVKVSQYWTFKRGAGDTPTLPAVAFQIFAFEVYDEFLRLLRRVSPSQAAHLPPHQDAIRAADIEKLMRALRTIFTEEPLTAQRMLMELQNARTPSPDMRTRQLLTSLIRMYQGADSRYLNFFGPSRTITTVPYYRVFQLREPSVAMHQQPDFTGKVVFVGLSERLRPEQKDGFYTVFSQPSGVDVSGVEIAATAFANLLEDRHIQPLHLPGYLATMMLWGVVLGVFCRLLPTTIAVVSAIGLGGVYLAAAYHQFQTTGMWYPLMLPLFVQLPFAVFGAVLWKYFDTNKERQNIKKLFGYYLPNKVVDQLVKNVADVKASNQLVYGTCLCTDAEQYTALAENMDPKELGGFINQYYEAVFGPVQQHGGIVSDVIGDSMLAIWAATHPDVVLRQRACLAALDIASAVRRFNQASETMQLPTRIGLHSGKMLLGHVGAITHYEYRAVGDIVNTTSRIQGLNKYLGTQILISEEVLSHLEGLLTRALGKFLFVGKSQPLVVYELIGRLEEVDQQQRSLCTDFAEAMDAYTRQSWDEAMERFDGCLKYYKEDGPSLFYMQLCEQYRENPPGESWNGVVRLMRK
jgi:adenylate cyclase